MCMLLIKEATATISRDLHDDLVKHNPDGFGLMYSEDGVLNVHKIVATADQSWELLNAHQHRPMVIHYRWNTHGDTDLLNAHPHEVFGLDAEFPLFMAHNGVLSTGNAKDKSKSDTIHYIADYIRPMLKGNPDWVHSMEFKSMLSKHIGYSNKFAFMDKNGLVSIINQSEFIEVDGLWFSNTYAVDAQRFGVRRKYVGYQGGFGSGGVVSNRHLWDDYDDYGYGSTVHPQEAAKKASSTAHGKASSNKSTYASADKKLGWTNKQSKTSKGKHKGAVKAPVKQPYLQKAPTTAPKAPTVAEFTGHWSKIVNEKITADMLEAPYVESEVETADDVIQWVGETDVLMSNVLTLERVVYALRTAGYLDVLELIERWETGRLTDHGFCHHLAHPASIANYLKATATLKPTKEVSNG